MIRFLLDEDRPGAIAVSLLALAFFVASWPLWTTNTWFFDDYWTCGLVESEGLAKTLHGYWTFMGLYRLVTLPYFAVMGPLCGVPVLAKALGLALHLAAGAGLYTLGRRRLGWERGAGLAAMAILVFNPLAFEAIAWVAAIKHFPLALVLVIIGADRLLDDQPRIGTAGILFTAAFMAAEQVIFLIGVIPLVAIRGSWGRRLIGTAWVVTPSIVYVVLVRLTGHMTTNPRLNADEVASPFNIPGNLRWAADYLPPMLPGGDTWNAFLSHVWTRRVWLGLALVFAAVAVTVIHDRNRDTTPRPLSQMVVAGVSVACLVSVVIPLLLPPASWATPRIWYLPHAALAMSAGALVQVARAVTPRGFGAWWSLLALTWIVWVLGGLSREARFYVDSFNGEASLAGEIAASLEDGEHLFLLNPPYTFVPESYSLGEHIAPAYAQDWTSLGAIRVLTDVNPSWVTVVRETGRFCRDQAGALRYDLAVLPERVELFDAADRRFVDPDTIDVSPC